MKRMVLTIGIAAQVMLVANSAKAKSSDIASYSLLIHSFAPNAGGQEAYSAKRSTDKNEWSLFTNNYLQANKRALMGGSYALRFPLCGHSCLVQAVAIAGGGLSTGGPYFEIGWSFVFLWLGRVDFTSQIFITQKRLITWSYPLWFGVSIPTPW